jgi:hypothetical protein
MAQAAKEERDKKAKFDRLPTLKDLTLPEFAYMRKRKVYELPRNTNDLSFHRREQELICTELYAKLTHKVCPQKVIDFEHLRKSDYFKDALCITKKLGLHSIMQLKLVEHKVVKPQKKPAPGVTNEPFAPSSGDAEDDEGEDEEDEVEEEEGEEEEEIEEVWTAPPSPPKGRSKNASNVPLPSRSKYKVNKEVKKLSWFKRTMLCMGVDIRKE